jgi:hypothetical protein
MKKRKKQRRTTSIGSSRSYANQKSQMEIYHERRSGVKKKSVGYGSLEILEAKLKLI